MEPAPERPAPAPNPPDAAGADSLGLFVFLLAVLLYMPGSAALAALFGAPAGGGLAQVLFFAALPLWILRRARLGLARFHLRLPRRGSRLPSLLLVPLLVLFFFQYEMFQEVHLYASRETLGAFYRKAFDLGSSPVWLLVLSVAVLPALCEELVFRGILLASLRGRLGAPVAVLLSAAAFALIHLHPLVLLPILILGVLLALLTALSRSVVPAVAVHFLNNLVVVAALTSPGLNEALARAFPYHAALPAVLLAAIAAVAVLGFRRVGGGAIDGTDPPE